MLPYSPPGCEPAHPQMLEFPLTYRPDEHEAFLGAVADWLRSDAIGWLLDRVALPVVLGRPEALRDPSATFEDIVAALAELDDWRAHGTAWDTRAQGERQFAELIASNGNGNRHIGDAEIRERATELGMRSCREATAGAHRVVVAMGGARMAPLRRTQWLADQLATGRIEADHFAALGCNRPLHDTHEAGVEYAGARASTEIDLLEGALRAALDGPVEWTRHERPLGVGPGEKTHWSWRRAPGMTLGPCSFDVHLVEAPTTRMDRSRVDTAESLEFLAGGRERLAGRELELPDPARPGIADRGLGLGPGDSVVLSTAPIYSAYTQLAGVRVLGLRGCSVETVAHPLTGASPVSPVGPLYVQEVRSAVQGALHLADALVR